MKCWELPKLQAGLLSVIQGGKTRLCFHLLERVETKSVTGTLNTQSDCEEERGLKQRRDTNHGSNSGSNDGNYQA